MPIAPEECVDRTNCVAPSIFVDLLWVFVPIILDAPPSRDMQRNGCAEW